MSKKVSPVFDAVDEAQMATDQVTPEQARAKLAARMKRDAKNPEATQAMGPGTELIKLSGSMVLKLGELKKVL